MARILVIDDEPKLRELLKSFLLLDGHEIMTAENGTEGLALVALSSYDLVITDIIMPEKDGFEVIQELACRDGSPKVIGITGGSRNMESEYLLKVASLFGSVMVLKKPVTIEVLRNAVAHVLSR